MSDQSWRARFYLIILRSPSLSVAREATPSFFFLIRHETAGGGEPCKTAGDRQAATLARSGRQSGVIELGDP